MHTKDCDEVMGQNLFLLQIVKVTYLEYYEKKS